MFGNFDSEFNSKLRKYLYVEVDLISVTVKIICNLFYTFSLLIKIHVSGAIYVQKM